MRRRQRGISLFGLMFWAILVGMFGYVIVVTLPTINEYVTIQRTVDKVAAAKPGDGGRGTRRVRPPEGHRVRHLVDLRPRPGHHEGKRPRRDRLRLQQGSAARRPVYILLKYQGRSK